MAFDPLEEERRRRGMRGMLYASAPQSFGRGGMLSAAGMPPSRASYVPQDPNTGNPFQTWQDAMNYYGSPAMQGQAWTPGQVGTLPQPGQDYYDSPATVPGWSGSDPEPSWQPSAEDIAAAKRTEPEWFKLGPPPGTPSDWIYIGKGDWGPMDVYGPSGATPMPTPFTQHLFPQMGPSLEGMLGGTMPKLTEAQAAAAYGPTDVGPLPGLLGPVTP